MVFFDIFWETQNDEIRPKQPKFTYLSSKNHKRPIYIVRENIANIGRLYFALAVKKVCEERIFD